MKRNLLVLGGSVVLACGLVLSGFAAEETALRYLTKDTFMEMESIGNPDISPDGQLILFTRSWVDQMSDRSAGNLWVTDVEGKRIRELTHGNWRDSSPVWSPCEKKIAFLSDRDGTNQIHVMWLDTRE
ncbi:MAG: DPP IV N-terminal domain-containing protein, partial [Candidatus Aminicenantes bacterium]|nr:DPP IV N-terminal domain-containing protein [Candidatus Aminicenantes bacterium]